MLLAIDTSSGTSAAVLDEDTVLSFVGFEDPFGHAENIGSAISQAISDAGLKPSEITAVAIGRGPAPYTGLRVGMAAGLAFASARSIPAYGVTTLAAVALEYPAGKVLVTSDAKRKELFAQTFEDGVPTSLAWVMNPSELESFQGHQHVTTSCDAAMIGKFAIQALAKGWDISDLSALYLRSPDVSPSAPKKVSG